MRERLTYRLSALVFGLDLVMTLVCLFIASEVRQRVDLGKELEPRQTDLLFLIYLAVALLWFIIFSLLQPHQHLFTGSIPKAISRLTAAILLASLSFAGLLYLSFREVSRLQFIYFVLFDICSLTAIHILARLYLPHTAPRRILVVGDGSTVKHAIEALERISWSGLKVVGYTSDELNIPGSFRRLGGIEETPNVVVSEQIDEIIFAFPPQHHDKIVQLSLKLAEQPVMLHMVPGILDLTFARTPVEIVGDIPLICLRESALTIEQRILKRCFDIIVSVGLLLLLAPVMLIIACLIKLESSGPVFFVQERIGENGRRFRMLKFRSMYADAEQRWSEVYRRNEHGQITHKFEDDPRITPLGRYLRRTSLDELPQLLNVLRGEMSLVGPRPEIPVIAAEYEAWQWHRFRVPPGMTGWWQINGRSNRPMHLHTQDDLYYIQNYSFWLDLQILLRTIPVVLRGYGAF